MKLQVIGLFWSCIGEVLGWKLGRITGCYDLNWIFEGERQYGILSHIVTVSFRILSVCHS
jgi:hypothetical protein